MALPDEVQRVRGRADEAEPQNSAGTGVEQLGAQAATVTIAMPTAAYSARRQASPSEKTLPAEAAVEDTAQPSATSTMKIALSTAGR